MIQDPDPTDDTELEAFVEWLYEQGHEPFALSCKEMQAIWATGSAILLPALRRARAEQRKARTEEENKARND